VSGGGSTACACACTRTVYKDQGAAVLLATARAPPAHTGECRQSADTPERVAFHLCIVNLVVGTLYCSKGNFEFGISRVIKAMHPLERKLGTDTWYYAKRCFLALAEGAAKHTVILSDSLFCEVCSFLDAAEAHGKAVATVVTRGAISESRAAMARGCTRTLAEPQRGLRNSSRARLPR